MYKYVVTIFPSKQPSDRAVSVEEIINHPSGSSIGAKTWYRSIDTMPDDIKNKVKQLLWVADDDQGLADGVGTRVGHNIFWIV